MNPKIEELFARIRQAEEEIEQEIQRRRAELHTDFQNRRIRFDREVLEQQRRFKQGLVNYLLHSEWRNVLTAPLIYAVFFPLLAVDLAVTLYQFICFPLYGIPRIRRRDYLVFDRTHLAYLNLVEKINCAYCSYGSGLASYLQEVIARTEQYWCPIKHARRILHAHPYYAGFVDYGDAEAYQRELQSLRKQLAELTETDRGNLP
ncbi:MAG: hypothetical protein KGN39_04675 [Betaproteobacteria bacterium]|nr:hypothetical protein [Betaproteobacteria bacterium]